MKLILAVFTTIHGVNAFMQTPKVPNVGLPRKTEQFRLHSSFYRDGDMSRSIVNDEDDDMYRDGRDYYDDDVIFARKAVVKRTTEEVWRSVEQISVQGGALKTCSFNEDIERVEVLLRTDGRPLTADVTLWQGPDNTPQKIGVYLEDGNMRPFRVILETRGSSNTVGIRNTGQLEFPIFAGVYTEYGTSEYEYDTESNRDYRNRRYDLDRFENSPSVQLMRMSPPRLIQGGAVYTVPFAPTISSVQVMLKTDGRPMNARIELLQGPNNNKQVMDIYIEDGYERPFFAIIETPGSGNVVRVVNTASVEFPISAIIEPHTRSEIDMYQSRRSGRGPGPIWS